MKLVLFQRDGNGDSIVARIDHISTAGPFVQVLLTRRDNNQPIEAALTRETALGFPAPPADDGDGAERGGDARYDIYVCDVASPGLGELAATVADPSGSGFSYIVVHEAEMVALGPVIAELAGT